MAPDKPDANNPNNSDAGADRPDTSPWQVKDQPSEFAKPSGTGEMPSANHAQELNAARPEPDEPDLHLAQPTASPTAAEPEPNNPADRPLGNPAAPALSGSPVAPPFVKPPARANKLGLFVVLAVLAIVLLGSFGVLALYNRPQTAVTDSVLKLAATSRLALEGKVSYADPSGTSTMSGDLKVRFNRMSNLAVDGVITGRGESPVTAKPETYTVNFAVVADSNQNFFVKFNDLKGTIEQLAGGGAAGKSASGSLNNFLTTVDGRWIRLSGSSVPQGPSLADQCFQKVFKDLASNRAERKKLEKLYRQNAFITPEASLPSQVINGRGSAHYKLRFDGAKANALAQAYAATDTYKKLQACDNSLKIDPELPTTINNLNQANVEIWVDYWTHDITRLAYDNSQKGSKGYFDFKYSDAATTVVVPSSSVPYQDALNALQKDLQFSGGSSLPLPTPTLPGNRLNPTIYQL
ncbi:MAG: hypothetical protein EOT04_00145 [Candidatus Chaera renei]|uniref:Uncharacterized protein n=1 Tax=Candidatus Chaera renei TaxID=2506947 RepID=A0A4Q0AKL9_9BACT|nr:MAG: hypothetical protein EOT04_00145 [Candidatus Chaera renei]